MPRYPARPHTQYSVSISARLLLTLTRCSAFERLFSDLERCRHAIDKGSGLTSVEQVEDQAQAAGEPISRYARVR
jgi:hypothetical protein